MKSKKIFGSVVCINHRINHQPNITRIPWNLLQWHLESICNLNHYRTFAMVYFFLAEKLVGCSELVESRLRSFLLATVHNSVIVCQKWLCWYYCWLALCSWNCLCLRIWIIPDLLHLISDLCGFCVPANIRSTLRRNTKTKISWSTATAVQKSTGKNTKREKRTKRRRKKRRFVHW